MGEFEYRPGSIRELLTEIKDLSELMIDLAYSAVLFNDKDIAKEVLKLDDRMDDLRDQLTMTNMLAVRDAEDAERGVGIASVASAADKISDAAVNIVYIVLRDIGPHRAIKEALEEAAERVGRVKLSEGSILTQGTLGDLQLPAKIGVDVIAIRRGERWIVKPEDDVLLRVGDVLIVRGSDDGMVVLKGLAAGAVQTLE